MDSDRDEFLDLLRTGQVTEGSKSQYVTNYNFFLDCIDKFIQDFPSYLPYFPARILANCILLPIEAESQDTALRIFSTLNDRGLPLSDADIFKAQLYQHYGQLNKTDDFIDDWKETRRSDIQNFLTQCWYTYGRSLYAIHVLP